VRREVSLERFLGDANFVLDVLLDAAPKVAGLLGNSGFNLECIISSGIIVQNVVAVERCLGDPNFVLDVLLDAATKASRCCEQSGRKPRNR